MRPKPRISKSEIPDLIGRMIVGNETRIVFETMREVKVDSKFVGITIIGDAEINIQEVLIPSEKIALADLMIERWQAYRETAIQEHSDMKVKMSCQEVIIDE